MTVNIRLSFKKRYILLLVLLSIYTAFGLSLNMEETSGKALLRKFEGNNHWTRLYAAFMVSMRHPRTSTVIFSLLAIMVFIMLLYACSNRHRFRELIIYIPAAIIFSVCQWIGTVYRFKGNWDPYLSSGFVFLKSLVNISSWFILQCAVFLSMNAYLNKSMTDVAGSSDGGKKAIMKTRIPVFLVTFLAIILCWLPYYIAFWPGTMHGDVINQILQYYHFPVHFQGRWITDGVNVLYTNDHPFIHTWLIGKFMDLGLKMGDIKMALGCLTGLQCILYALGYSTLITSLWHFGMNRLYLKIAVAIYALLPIFPMYGILICGDTFLGLFYMAFVIMIIWIYQTGGKILKSKVFLILLFLSVLGLGMAKNQGIYIALVMIILTVILFREYWKQLLVAMVLPVLVFYIGYQGIFFRYCHVESVGRQEAMSFFFQQTARYVRDFEEKVTDEEKQAIDAVLEYDVLAKRYDPDLCDPVKKTFRKNATSQDMARYFSTWFSMGCKHPAVYMQAFFAGTWMYYAPGYSNAEIYYRGLSSLKHYVQKYKIWYENRIPDSFVDSLDYGLTKDQKETRKIYYSYLLSTKYIPIVNWLILPGCVTWLMLSCYMAFWTKKNYRAIFMYLPLFLVFGICLLSPKNGNVRYLFPVYTILPGMICTAMSRVPEVRKDD